MGVTFKTTHREPLQFGFATANQIVFGAGTLRNVFADATTWGSRALLVTGSDPNRSASVRLIAAGLAGLEIVAYSVAKEPTAEIVDAGVRLAKAEACDVIIGCGGGSVIDAGKAVAALLTNGGSVLDYIGSAATKRLSLPSAPYIAIPATAGTGAEVTRNAVISLPQEGMKISLRSDFMIPKVAIIDPELALTLPPSLTASTGLDALTQVIEPYVALHPHPIADLFCRDGIQRASKYLRCAYQYGTDLEAREEMALVSLYGGMALANGQLGAVHGFASPIGGMFSAPHGAVCGRLLPLVMECNVRALRKQKAKRTLARYGQVARWLTGEPQAEIEDGIEWVKALVAEFRIPGLSAYGITLAHISEIALKAQSASSMQGNPIRLTHDELSEILTLAL